MKLARDEENGSLHGGLGDIPILVSSPQKTANMDVGDVVVEQVAVDLVADLAQKTQEREGGGCMAGVSVGTGVGVKGPLLAEGSLDMATSVATMLGEVSSCKLGSVQRMRKQQIKWHQE